MFNNRKELNIIKRQCGVLKAANIKLKIKNNLKIREVCHLRRQLEAIEKKCRKILDRGKQYIKEERLGKKYMERKQK